MSAILVVPDEDGAALLDEARRLAEALGASGGDGRTDDRDDGGDRPSVVAVAFDGLVDPAALSAEAPDETVHVVAEVTDDAADEDAADDAAEEDADDAAEEDAGDGPFTARAAGVGARADALAALVRDTTDVRAVLLPDTPDGTDLAAAAARRLRSGCVTDCLLRVRDGELTAGRPAYGGRAYAELDFEREPAVATLNREALGTPAEPPSGSPSVRTFEVGVETDDRIRHVETVDVPESDLAKARRIVAGGYGLGGPDGFDIVEDLADALGAALGASRPPADEDWVPYDRQIGVTGKEIDVDLYVPLAISGDSYHMRSVNAEHLIPINSDPGARIFNFADIGIVGDAYEYAPAIAEAVRAATAEAAAGPAADEANAGADDQETETETKTETETEVTE